MHFVKLKCPTVNHGGGKAFTSKGFTKQMQPIQTAIEKQHEEVKPKHWVHLNASVEVGRQLLNGAFLFQGHDESEFSTTRGHFVNCFFF